ncbi:MAG: hypothetical protein HY308_03655 [Gammaproteobacteria bacterium]|nr:hypothetical protein [Gammaproteobacteria bacterium]
MSTTAATDNNHSQIRLGLKMSIPALFPGDIIALDEPALRSVFIRWSTGGAYNHAILYRGSRLAVDAMPGPGVTQGFLARKLGAAKFTTAAVFRHRTASREQCEIAAKWAEKQVGKPYDFVSATLVGLQPGAPARGVVSYGPLSLRVLPVLADKLTEEETKSGNRPNSAFMCSGLILRAFEVAGAPIIDTPANFSSPGKFLETYALAYMGNLDTA